MSYLPAYSLFDTDRGKKKKKKKQALNYGGVVIRWDAFLQFCHISRRLNILSVFSSLCSDEDSPHSFVCVGEEERPPSS